MTTPVLQDLSYFGYDRPEVAALIPATARRVLDMGCGAGRLGALLKERQHAEVVGIERSRHVADLHAAMVLRDPLRCPIGGARRWSVGRGIGPHAT
jgi:trans-aconitate methyltransferase